MRDDASFRPLSELDLRLIHILQLDGRRSSTEIARELGVSESTVRRRIESLVEEKVIQISAVSDPMRIGFSLWVVIEIQVELTHLEEVATRLAELPEVSFVAITTGAFDIMCTAIFSSHSAFYDFLTRKLASLEGIKSTASSTILRTTKRSFALGNPRETATPARTRAS